MKRLSLLFGLLACFACTDLSAQITAKSPLAGTSASAPELAFNEWSIYADQESSTYFIDFEQLAVNVNTVVVKTMTGQEVWRDEVFDLPVNSIYELDFSQYRAGEYLIELQAITGVIRKTVSHR